MEIRNICFPVKYDSQGEERTKWISVGTMFIKEEGGETKISFILDALPNGEKNLHAFPIRDKDAQQGGGYEDQTKPQKQTQETEVPVINLDDDADEIDLDDVPF